MKPRILFRCLYMLEAESNSGVFRRDSYFENSITDNLMAKTGSEKPNLRLMFIKSCIIVRKFFEESGSGAHILAKKALSSDIQE